MQYLHTMLRVSDLEANLDFFCNKLGLVEVERKENKLARFTLVFLADPVNSAQASQTKSPLIELTYNWPDEKGNTETYTYGRSFGHLAFRVDNIYALCTDLMNKGVIINRPPRDGYMAFIKSPEGISIELLQKNNPLEKAQPWASMQNIGTW